MSGPSDPTGASGAAGAPAAADLRLALPAAAAWAAALSALTRPPQWTLWIGALLAALGVALGTLARRCRRPSRVTAAARRSARRSAMLVSAAVCACAAGASVATAIHMSVIGSGPVVRLAAQAASVRAEAVVTADPVLLRSRVVGNSRAPTEYAVRADLLRVVGRGTVVSTREPVLLIAPGAAWEDVLPGQTVRVAGRLRAADPSGGDDVAAILSVRGRPELVGRPPPLQRLAGAVRARLRQSVAGLPAAERGLLPGLVDGDTSGLPEATALDFTTAGMTHLVAVSGQNVARGRWLAAQYKNWSVRA